MTELMEIQSFIQAYVQAVAAIIEAEVTVVDSEYKRVGGTGDYALTIGKSISHGAFFEKIFTTAKPGIIRNVRKELSCADCEKKDTCKELANLGYPIFFSGKVIGVIGIIAFNAQTRQRLINDHAKLEEFIKYTSQLIESKIVNFRQSQNLKSQLDEVIISSQNSSQFVGSGKKATDILHMIEKITNSDSTVLITGESGTGKEVIAKMVHSTSLRNDKLMISINCGAIPENLVESELFGYEEGAFTGAKKGGNIGKFELADGSTLFLDEIGEMPLHVQTKLLRVLQEQTVERIGGKKPIPVNVRVICATNRDLWQMVEEGKFRKDLYYRLNVIPINIPPLRERKEDIPQLIDRFVKEYNSKLRKKVETITPSAMDMLIAYDWPGNVRELKNVIEYLINIVESSVIDVTDLPNTLISGNSKDTGVRNLADIMASYEKAVLKNMVKKADTLEKKQQLAAQLGISRATLYRKLNEYGL